MLSIFQENLRKHISPRDRALSVIKLVTRHIIHQIVTTFMMNWYVNVNGLVFWCSIDFSSPLHGAFFY